MAYDPLAALANNSSPMMQRPMAQAGYPALSYDSIQNAGRRRNAPWASQYGANPDSYAAAMVQGDPYAQTPDVRPGKYPPYWQTPDVRPGKDPYQQTPDVRPPVKQPPYTQTPDVRPNNPSKPPYTQTPDVRQPRPVVDRFIPPTR